MASVYKFNWCCSFQSPMHMLASMCPKSTSRGQATQYECAPVFWFVFQYITMRDSKAAAGKTITWVDY